jgi:ankyrin repeat protein
MLLRSATNSSLTKELLSGVSFVDVDTRDDTLGLTALMHLANMDFRSFSHYENDMTSNAMALLEFCDVNLTDSIGRTALHMATENNPVVGVVLLENGADPTIRDEKGRTPLDLVDADFLKYKENIMLLERLLEAGAVPYAVSPDDWSDEDSEEDAVEGPLSEASGGDNDPCTFYSYLSASEYGREFIRTHAQYFPRGGEQAS